MEVLWEREYLWEVTVADRNGNRRVVDVMAVSMGEAQSIGMFAHTAECERLNAEGFKVEMWNQLVGVMQLRPIYRKKK